MPPLQYHYLRRPYELVPFGAAEIPRAVYLDATARRLPDSAPAERVAFSVYDIRIRQGVMYQPQPGLCRGRVGKPRYLNLGREDLRNISSCATSGTAARANWLPRTTCFRSAGLRTPGCIRRFSV